MSPSGIAGHSQLNLGNRHFKHSLEVEVWSSHNQSQQPMRQKSFIMSLLYLGHQYPPKWHFSLIFKTLDNNDHQHFSCLFGFVDTTVNQNYFSDTLWFCVHQCPSNFFSGTLWISVHQRPPNFLSATPWFGVHQCPLNFFYGTLWICVHQCPPNFLSGALWFGGHQCPPTTIKSVFWILNPSEKFGIFIALFENLT